MAGKVKKGKVCSSIVCTICCNSSPAGDAVGDFVGCQKCGVWIHKICFGLSGDLLDIFEEFQARCQKFPFTVLCSECRQFTEKPDKVVHECQDATNIIIRKNPFEIDCVVQVILEHLNIQDLTNIRLVNKLCNETASRLLSKDSRQDQIEVYDVIRKNPDLAKCLQFMKDSSQKNLFRKLELNHLFVVPESDEVLYNDFKMFNEVVKISKPTNVSITYHYRKMEHLTFTLSTLLVNVSENVVDLRLTFFNLKNSDLANTDICMPKFSKLKSLSNHHLLQEDLKLMKMIIKNSPKLMNLSLRTPWYSDFIIDDYFKKENEHCLLSEESTVNLQQLNLFRTHFNFETFFNQLKLKTLSLHSNINEFEVLEFGKLSMFLAGQNETLITFEIYFKIAGFVERSEENLENAQMDLPRLENVQHFLIANEFYNEDDEFGFHDMVCKTNEEIWPVKPIDLSAKLPNLKKITISYCQSWALSFDQERNYPHVTELVFVNCMDGCMYKLAKLFPQVEFLNLKNFCYYDDGYQQIHTELKNLDGWSKSLKRIEITCEHYQLDKFGFQNLVCLTNLKSIKISQVKDLEDGFPDNCICPNFQPLFEIPALSQVVIKNFKILKCIVEDLREKYPSLDYSFYPNNFEY